MKFPFGLRISGLPTILIPSSKMKGTLYTLP